MCCLYIWIIRVIPTFKMGLVWVQFKNITFVDKNNLKPQMSTNFCSAQTTRSKYSYPARGKALTHLYLEKTKYIHVYIFMSCKNGGAYLNKMRRSAPPSAAVQSLTYHALDAHVFA